MYYVYIIKSDNFEKFYIGCTDNIERRLIEHNKGKSFYTKRYMPWHIHYLEKYNNKLTAFEREKYFKTHAGRNFLKKVRGGSSIG